MAKEAAETVMEKLDEVGPSVAVTFLMGPESYFEVISGLVDNFCRKNDLDCIYVAVSVPARTIMGAFDSLEIDRGHVRFVDCISYATMQSVDSEEISFVESPSMLETIILRVRYLFRKFDDGKRKVVIIDSANALSMHNDVRMLTGFIHVLMTALKEKEAYPVILGLGDQLRPEVKEMLGLLSDQVVDVPKSGE
ncbi:MAG: hypothetical protein HPY73_05265 [Methanomassiliicoccales archaeon]|nr:MAG: hypothetical protein HPY73_05265 [Methanomassiliicoccales archaeon]